MSENNKSNKKKQSNKQNQNNNNNKPKHFKNNNNSNKQNTVKQKIPVLFKIKKDGVDYSALNFVIKMVGFISVSVGIILLTGMLKEAILDPVKKILSLLSPFLIAIILSYLLHPLYDFFRSRKMKPFTASLLTTLIGVVAISIIIIGIIAAIVNPLSSEVGIKNGYLFIKETGSILAPLLIKFGFDNFIGVENGIDILELVANDQYTALLGSGGGTIAKFLIVIPAMLYIMPTFSTLNKNIKKAIPKKFRKTISKYIDIIIDSFTKYIRSALFVASFIFLSYVIVLLIITMVSNILYHVFNVAHYCNFIFVINSPIDLIIILLIIFSLGILAMFADLIPYIGPFIGGTPIALLIFLTEGIGTSGDFMFPWFTFYVIIAMVVIQQLESSFLHPYLMSKRVSLHPVIILMGLTVFGSTIGMLGLFISTPILVTIKNIILHIDKEYEIF